MNRMKGHKWAGFERFSIHLSIDDARACSQPGKDASEDVAAVVRLPYVASQLDAIPADKIRAELKEYGAWDESERANDEANRERIVWLAACDIRESMK